MRLSFSPWMTSLALGGLILVASSFAQDGGEARSFGGTPEKSTRVVYSTGVTTGDSGSSNGYPATTVFGQSGSNTFIVQGSGNFQEQQSEAQKLARRDRDLEKKVRETLQKYAQSSSAERGDHQAALEKLLTEQFEVRHQIREQEVKQIEQRLRRLREALQKRQDARMQIVRNRLQALVQEAEGLGWGSGASGGRFLSVVAPESASGSTLFTTPVQTVR